MLKTLPRDSRDTLFLLGVIGWVVAPHLGHLPPWCVALVALVLLWRGGLAWRARPLPARRWLLLLLALTVLATLADFRTLQGRDAGVALSVALLALKTLELRARRDAFVVFFLGFFVMLTDFLYSQSLPVAAGVLLGLWGLLTALVNSHRPVGRPPLRECAGTAARMMALGTPVLALLFLLFPRVAPLWGNPDELAGARSGLSATMRVGNIAQLALDDGVVMRLRFTGTQPLPQDLYFRGPVLSGFDGRQWSPLRPTFSAPYQVPTALRVSGAPLRYQATLEPTQRRWLLLLDAAPAPPQSSALAAGVRMSSDLQWQSAAPITEVLRYEAQSYPQFRHGPTRPSAALQDYLQLPPGHDPRTQALARELRHAAPGADDAALVQAALTRLRTGGYRYTLEPGVYGEHTADEFWFERKEGFCEHIASAFAVLLRAMGIPARIVTGYQGGERNALDDFWVVRQSDAHAWVEAWLAGQGWVRVDPTAAVAPGRIGALQRLAAPRGVIATALGAVSPGLALNLRALWDALNHRWNQWVLDYTQARQLDLLRRLGWDAPAWEDLAWLLLAGGGLLLLAALAWAAWQARERDPWLRLLARAQRHLARAGLAPAPQATPRALAAQLRAASPVGDNRHRTIGDWLLRLEAQRYAPATEHERRGQLRRLQREARRLPWPP